MSITQMMPEDIYYVFIARINRTNLLYNTLDEDSLVELYNTLYFKYYFDISTAIESVIRGITYVECKNNKYLTYLAEPESDSKAYFLKYEEIKVLIDLNKIFSLANKAEFESNYCRKVAALKSYTVTKSFKNDGTFSEIYTSIRRTRNALAHGLKAATTVDFDTSTTESYLYVLYLLSVYYKSICD